MYRGPEQAIRKALLRYEKNVKRFLRIVFLKNMCIFPCLQATLKKMYESKMHISNEREHLRTAQKRKRNLMQA